MIYMVRVKGANRTSKLLKKPIWILLTTTNEGKCSTMYEECQTDLNVKKNDLINVNASLSSYKEECQMHLTMYNTSLGRCKLY